MVYIYVMKMVYIYVMKMVKIMELWLNNITIGNNIILND